MKRDVETAGARHNAHNETITYRLRGGDSPPRLVKNSLCVWAGTPPATRCFLQEGKASVFQSLGGGVSNPNYIDPTIVRNEAVENAGARFSHQKPFCLYLGWQARDEAVGLSHRIE